MARVPFQLAVSLADIRKRCPRPQQKYLKRFIALRNMYEYKISTLPPELPKIDWEFYKRNVRAESVGLIEEFQKKYQKITIPFPEDKYSQAIDQAKSEVKTRLDAYKNSSNERISVLQKQLDKMKNMTPYSEMSLEELCYARPDIAPDFINRPTFWPHTEDEQIGYAEEMARQAAEAEAKEEEERKIEEELEKA